ncbi:hypothetical protein Tco_1107031 [Tanacetum coccineum]
MLTTEEMRLKFKSQALPVDSSSSSPMILLAKSGQLGVNNTGTNTLAPNRVTNTDVSTAPIGSPVAYHTLVSPPGFHSVGHGPSYQPNYYLHGPYVQVPPGPVHSNTPGLDYQSAQLAVQPTYLVVSPTQPNAQMGRVPIVPQA